MERVALIEIELSGEKPAGFPDEEWRGKCQKAATDIAQWVREVYRRDFDVRVRRVVRVDAREGVMSKRMMIANVGGGHLCGASCACRKKKHPTKIESVVAATVRRVIGESQQSGALREVEAELKKHPDAFAVVNGRGVVRTFLQPKPYYETPARNDAPSDAVGPEVQELRTRVSRLATELAQVEANHAPSVVIMRLEGQLDAARRELEAAEAGRDYERKRQRVGDLPERASPTAVQQFLEPVPYYQTPKRKDGFAEQVRLARQYSTLLAGKGGADDVSVR